MRFAPPQRHDRTDRGRQTDRERGHGEDPGGHEVAPTARPLDALALANHDDRDGRPEEQQRGEQTEADPEEDR
jgi:hypothetical protein